MPTIIRAEYLSYYHRLRNSDKLFNIFLIREDDGTFSCLTENGRRGSSLVRRAVCEEVRRETAESKFWEKVRDKRNHSETPYKDEPFGKNYSRIASQYISIAQANNSSFANETKAVERKSKVIEFPVEINGKKQGEAKPNGILNSEQFDSLEF
jgi:hypothetical protein